AALIEAALRAHEKAGIPRTASLGALEPIVRETVDAIFEKGPAGALTGPISRGDVGTVAHQLATGEGWGRGLGMLYRGLGQIAIELARRDGRLDRARAVALETILKESSGSMN